MAALSLDTIIGSRKHRPPNGRCRACGEHPPVAVVRMQIRKLINSEAKGASTSQQLSLCESCAVDLWGRLDGEWFDV